MSGDIHPRTERELAARARAIRAARAVSLALLVGVVPGCAASIGAPDTTVTMGTPDAGREAAVATPDAGRDVIVADGEVCDPSSADYAACCDRINWDWNRGCQAWGPFVPPAMPDAVSA